MPRRIFSGIVVSDKCDKTVVVRVEESLLHPLYGKRIRRYSKFHAHDENNTFHVGEKVDIQESRPFSKMKKWIVLEKRG